MFDNEAPHSIDEIEIDINNSNQQNDSTLSSESYVLDASHVEDLPIDDEVFDAKSIDELPQEEVMMVPEMLQPLLLRKTWLFLRKTHL